MKSTMKFSEIHNENRNESAEDIEWNRFIDLPTHNEKSQAL